MSTEPYAVKSGGQLDASAVVKAAPGIVWSVEVITDGTNTATVTIYDAATATTSGKTILSQVIVAGAARFDGHDFARGVAASEGIYCVISGTGAKAIVFYS